MLTIFLGMSSAYCVLVAAFISGVIGGRDGSDRSRGGSGFRVAGSFR